jgi:L-asparagine transporter-like permease
MRHLRNGIVTLIATAAVLVPATAASATQQDGLVNVYATNIANGNQTTLLQNVSVPVAANFCGIQVAALTAALLQGQATACTAATNSTQTAIVSWL